MDFLGEANLTRETPMRSAPRLSQQVMDRIAADDGLEIFMGSIPRSSDDSRLRFTSQDVNRIKDETKRLGLPPRNQFINEFSTMRYGDRLPTLGDLYDILVGCELFRAADFLAAQINIPRPERPATGPARLIDISLEGETALVLSNVNIDRKKASPVARKVNLSESANQTKDNEADAAKQKNHQVNPLNTINIPNLDVLQARESRNPEQAVSVNRPDFDFLLSNRHPEAAGSQIQESNNDNPTSSKYEDETASQIDTDDE